MGLLVIGMLVWVFISIYHFGLKSSLCPDFFKDFLRPHPPPLQISNFDVFMIIHEYANDLI